MKYETEFDWGGEREGGGRRPCTALGGGACMCVGGGLATVGQIKCETELDWRGERGGGTGVVGAGEHYLS